MAATRIKSQDILDGTVATADLANDAVDETKLGITTTKGDLIVHDGTTTNPKRLAVGTDGKVLTADSAATEGVSWQTALLASNVVESETPSGTVNGANVTFNLANTPTAGSVKLYKNGIRQRAGAGNDYTIATGTITFEAGNVPQTGDVLLADYRK
jgi:hypothetical protein